MTQSPRGACNAHGPGRKAALQAEQKAIFGLQTPQRLKSEERLSNRTKKHAVNHADYLESGLAKRVAISGRRDADKRIELGCDRLTIGRVKRSLSLQQNTGNIEKPVCDTSDSTPMGAAALTQRGVTTAALGIVLNRNACPVVDGVTQSRVRSVAHHNDARFTTSLGHRCNAGQRPQRRVIASAERSRSFGKERGEVDPADPRQ